MHIAVCNGFKQVVTFILSDKLTVFLSLIYTPGTFSNSGRPLGKLSSITRYWGSSALIKGAIYVFLLVIIIFIFLIPNCSRDLATFSLGLGVILSIILQGKETIFSSWI